MWPVALRSRGSTQRAIGRARPRTVELVRASGPRQNSIGMRRSPTGSQEHVSVRVLGADRRTSSTDRDAGAAERSTAGFDRASSHADRDAAARDRDDASVDTLTGVSHRAAGFLALNREIARARRTSQSLVVGFVDVDHLKLVNDRDGHAAGDQTLLNVANALRSHLRAYDVIFRYGGDEFVCGLSGVDVAFCEARMTQVNEELAEGFPVGSVTVGFAALHPHDSSADLVARADGALYRKRENIRMRDL